MTGNERARGPLGYASAFVSFSRVLPTETLPGPGAAGNP